jgi:hypothetical protein
VSQLCLAFLREIPYSINWKRYIMLTYEDLAQTPQRIDLDVPNYSHSSQTGTGISMVTFNGTRTYNGQGAPSDSDQD